MEKKKNKTKKEFTLFNHFSDPILSRKRRDVYQDTEQAGLSQDCIIKWMDDDDRLPRDWKKVESLFQSPNASSILHTPPSSNILSSSNKDRHGADHSIESHYVPRRNHRRGEIRVNFPEDLNDNTSTCSSKEEKIPQPMLATQPTSATVTVGYGPITSISSPSSSPLNTSPKDHQGIQRRKRIVTKPIDLQPGNGNSNQNPLSPCRFQTPSSSHCFHQTTSSVRGSPRWKKDGLLFDLPTCWKEYFQSSHFTPAKYNPRNNTKKNDRNSSPSSSTSEKWKENQGDELDSCEKDPKQSCENSTSCRRDLVTAFTHICDKENINQNMIQTSICSNNNIDMGDTSNVVRGEEMIHCHSTSHDKKENEIHDDFLFDFVDLNEDVMAAVDAAIHARTATQDWKDGSLSNGDTVQPVQLATTTTTTTSLLQVDPTSQEGSLMAPVVTSSHVPSTELDDVFGDFPDIDFDTMDKLVASRSSHIMNATQSSQVNCSKPTVHSKDGPEWIRFTRYEICTIIDDTTSYTKSLGVQLWRLKAHEEDIVTRDDVFTNHNSLETGTTGSPEGYIHLRGEWYHSKCEVGDVIHICSISGRFDTGLSALPLTLQTPSDVNDADDDLVMVVHPDLLVTPTSISETINCNRRAVLMTRLGSSGLSSKAAIIGTMRHDLFQRCLFHKNFTAEFAMKQVPFIVRNHAETILGLGTVDEREIMSEVMKILSQLQSFATKFTSFYPSSTSDSHHTGSILEGHGIKTNIVSLANEVHATEESAVSHELGLKGFVDATVETITTNYPSTHTANQAQENEPLRSLMAIELKTGHNQNSQHSHMAQLALYTVMLRARHGSAVLGRRGNDFSMTGLNGAGNSGMLLYLNHESHRAIHVSPINGEVKSLINQRNVVATEIRRSLKPRGVIAVDDNEVNSKLLQTSKRKEERTIILPAPPTALPDLLFSARSCERCYSNRECMLYAKADIINDAENMIGPNKTHTELIKKFTGHLSTAELQYFRDWDRLIDFEANATNHEIAKAWLTPSHELEKTTGKCISSLMIDESSFCKSIDYDPADLDESFLVFKLYRMKDASILTPLNALRFSEGDILVVSTDNVTFDTAGATNFRARDTNRVGTGRHIRMNVLKGTLKKIDVESLVVRCSERDARQISNIMQIQLLSPPDTVESRLCFRVDKDESAVGTTTLRKNLVDFLTADVPTPTSDSGDKGFNHLEVSTSTQKKRIPRLRELIINLQSPRFRTSTNNNIFNLPSAITQLRGCTSNVLTKDFANLNIDQQAAVDKVVRSLDYVLVQGLPGSGKSSTISFVARLLAAQGKRVLVTSYTHAAVDTLLIKMMESGVGTAPNNSGLHDVIRIGHEAQCHPTIRKILVSNIASKLDQAEERKGVNSSKDIHSRPRKPSVQSLQRVISAARIVGVSALTIPRTPLLSGQHFDYVIIDEAGQISQPAILGALMAADIFILVGDQEQLPPLVQSQLAEQGGYSTSMLKRLADSHPSAVAQLTLQYRMNESICFLCNEIIYRGKLKCANEEVLRGRLKIASFPGALAKLKIDWKPGSGVGWLLQVINPNKPVVFVDTDLVDTSPPQSLPNLEIARGKKKDGGNIINEVEAILSRIIVNGLIACGLEPTMMGLICPYRSQIKFLDDDSVLASMKMLGLEISTIDRYQGRDKEAIILSLVRSNEQGKTGRLLDDYRRLNVAVSRAKQKLIIIGSFLTLSKGSAVLGPLLTVIKEKGWVEALPQNALTTYGESLS